MGRWLYVQNDWLSQETIALMYSLLGKWYSYYDNLFTDRKLKCPTQSNIVYSIVLINSWNVQNTEKKNLRILFFFHLF